MGIELSTERRNDLLLAHLEGEFEIYGMKGAYGEVLAEVKEHSIRFLIIDMRQVGGEISITDKFYLAEFASRLSVRKLGSLTPKIAVLVDASLIDSERFAETVARNRGMDAHVCAEMDEALQWLGME